MGVYQISKVIQEARVLDINTQVIYPLGETAAAIRGENELWLAMVLRNKVLLDLKPSQLAAVCGSLVSEGIKIRPWKNSRYTFQQRHLFHAYNLLWLLACKASCYVMFIFVQLSLSFVVVARICGNALAYNINQLDHQSHVLC